MKHSAVLLTLHNTVGIITLIGVAAVIFTVIFLFSTSQKEEDKKTIKEKVYGFRRRYFWGLTALLAISFFTSLAFLPYNKSAKADETIFVLSFQWGWRMAPGSFAGDLNDFVGDNTIDLTANDNIKFIVTSKDVNHSFGIYNDKGELISQVQAMPGYKNELFYKFKDKGVYKVLCMEYCGLAHAMMIATINVN